jgi:sortase A
MKLLTAIILIAVLGGSVAYRSQQVFGISAIPAPTSAHIGIVPIEISIPKLGVVATVEEVGLNENRRMDIPQKDQNAAWYSLGTRPGERGSAVIAGHFDTRGGQKGIFHDLEQLEIGDEMLITNESGDTYKFIVEEKQTFPDSQFPVDYVFTRNDKPRLNLITCEGDFDPVQRNYLDRTVVFAVFLQ